MPTVPYVRNPTWADGPGGGTAISAAKLNVLDNGIYEVSYAPAVRVFHNAAQSLTSGVDTVLAFNSERFDQAGNAADTQHDTVTNNSRLTCRYAGVYLIGTNIQWSASPVTATLRIRLNNTTDICLEQFASTDSRVMELDTIYLLAVNDFLEVRATQSSGGALNVNSSANFSPEFWMVRVA